MSDLFHELVPNEFIAEVFTVMADLPQHTFQILTKRPDRAAAWAGPWPSNIWMGTSVEKLGCACFTVSVELYVLSGIVGLFAIADNRVTA
jgi:protein gp37